MRHRSRSTRLKLDARLARVGDLSPLARPAVGWIRAIRTALGMTTRQLANRLGISDSRVTAIEQDELKDALKISTLKKAAEALGCDLVYALVPRQPLETMVHEQACQLAQQVFEQTGFAEAISSETAPEDAITQQIEAYAQELLIQSESRLWEAG